jgi:hypothetical protein
VGKDETRKRAKMQQEKRSSRTAVFGIAAFPSVGSRRPPVDGYRLREAFRSRCSLRCRADGGYPALRAENGRHSYRLRYTSNKKGGDPEVAAFSAGGES